MIYLDNAATSHPKPEAVYLRVDEILRHISGSPGRASHRMAIEATRVVFNAREALASLINVSDSSRIVFTKNATEAINIALKGLLKGGDHLVTTTIEHNSVARTTHWLEDHGVGVTRVSPGPIGVVGVEEISRAIGPKTKMVCITHASNVFGAIQPVEELSGVCRDKGVLFMVDCAQTAGALPLDAAALGVDILAGTGHKALFGPQGTGFLYLGDGIEPEALVSGGTGEIDVVLEVPDRLEAGTINTPGIGGLAAGVEFLLAEDVARVRAHEQALMAKLLSGLMSIGNISIIGPLSADERVSLVAFNIHGKTAASVGSRLDEEFGILVRSGAHCAPGAHREAGTHPEGAVRVSPGYFTTLGDIDAVISAVEEIART